MLSMNDNGEMKPVGMDLHEAKLHVSEQDAEAFHQSRSLYVSYDTGHGTRGCGDEMTKHQGEATARDDDGTQDSVMATGSLRKRTKPKNESSCKGTKRQLEGTLFIIGGDDGGTDDKRKAAPRTPTRGPTRWQLDLVSRCEQARQQAIIRDAEATVRDNDGTEHSVDATSHDGEGTHHQR